MCETVVGCEYVHMTWDLFSPPPDQPSLYQRELLQDWVVMVMVTMALLKCFDIMSKGWGTMVPFRGMGF